MRRPGTDPDHVRMSDVLCDFCRREWAEEVPMIEGHHGSCICGRCLAVAYSDLVLQGTADAGGDFTCPMCLESNADRAALGRGDELGWRSPLDPAIAICRRCVRQAAGVLHKDPDFDWRKPERRADG